MGNKISFHPRLVLTQDIALHFMGSDLDRDVLPIIEKWSNEGAELCFGLDEFQGVFDLVIDIERQFNIFDTDQNGKVDAHEVLMAYVLLCSGDEGKKIETVFSIFDFSLSMEGAGTINFDEAKIMIDACVRGVEKVCETDFGISDDELLFQCKQLFDMFRIVHGGRISLQQLREWIAADPSPRGFIFLLQHARGLPDLHAAVQKRNLEQSRVFQLLARGKLFVSEGDIQASEDFRRAAGLDVSDDDFALLVELMFDRGTPISSDRYHAVLRPWNVFCESDLEGQGTLDENKSCVLLWIQLRQKPPPELVREFLAAVDTEGNRLLSRREWIAALRNVQDCDSEQPDWVHLLIQGARRARIRAGSKSPGARSRGSARFRVDARRSSDFFFLE